MIPTKVVWCVYILKLECKVFAAHGCNFPACARQRPCLCHSVRFHLSLLCIIHGLQLQTVLYANTKSCKALYCLALTFEYMNGHVLDLDFPAIFIL